MLKKLTIKNFKAIQDMTIEFTPLTVLIGENGCGKSTVLQALDFLRSAATRDIPEYLRERGWAFEELKSKFDEGINKPLEFTSEWEFIIDENKRAIHWDISIDLFRGVDWRINEKIENAENIVLLCHGRGEKAIPESFKNFYFQSSMLKYYDPAEDEKELIKLKEFLSSSVYYGVLSPDVIRLGKKTGVIGNIGNSGEWLSAFIYHIDDDGRKKLNRLVSDIVGIEIEIQVIDAGSAFILATKGLHDTKEVIVDSWHTSDGLLRIIAFAAITLQRFILRHGASDGGIRIKADGAYKYNGSVEWNRGIFLLDEIENGINPYIIEKIIGILKELTGKNERQIIITTHSPLVADFVNPEDILFLWKNTDGDVACGKMFEKQAMRECLDFLNPGEIWYNYGKDTIIQKLNGSEKEEAKQ
jgi:predicted ATPase